MIADELHHYIYSRIDELPTLPAVVPKILQVMEDPEVNAGQLAELISHDPALAAKVLKVANSAYYGFSAQIDNLRHAVPLLGLNMTKSLALSIGVMTTLPGVKTRQYFSEEGLWRHSIGVAMLIVEMSERYCKGASGEYLFVMGLLHDVGKIVLDSFFTEKFDTVLFGVSQEKGAKLHEVESEVIGIDHTTVTAMLITRWRFPDSIVGPIADMHKREPRKTSNQRDVALLRIANSLSQKLAYGEEGNSHPNSIRKADMELLKVGEAELKSMLEYGDSVKEEVVNFLNAVN